MKVQRMVLATAMAAIALAGMACQGGTSQEPPATSDAATATAPTTEAPQAARATFERFAPAGAVAGTPELEHPSGVATWSVEYSTPDGKVEVTALPTGTLLAIEHEVEVAVVPAAISAPALAVAGGQLSGADRVRLAAFELEDTLANGATRERFVDPTGRVLLERTVPGGPEEEAQESLEEIPEAARAAIERESNGATLTRLQREQEWGLPVHAAAWQESDGPHELKVTDDGTPLYLELPLGPVPDAVLALIAATETDDEGEETDDEEPGAVNGVESLLLFAWELEVGNEGQMTEVLILSTGEVLAVESSKRSSEDTEE